MFVSISLPGEVLSQRTKAISLPSGDQAGASLLSFGDVKQRRPLPSVLMTQICAQAGLHSTKLE